MRIGVDTTGAPRAMIAVSDSPTQPMRMDCGSVPASEATDARWYCVRTQYRHELVALAALWRDLFRAHLPQYVSRTRGNAPLILPLFPRYLFVRFATGRDPWRRVFSARGVERLFMADATTPLPLPAGVVEQLQARGRPGDGVIDDRVTAPTLLGRTVAVTVGPFADARGLCVMSGEQRVQVLLEVLGRRVQVTVPRGHVAVA